MWLKKIRLSERLIGPFGWSAFTRSFDGAEFKLDRQKFNITAMASRPTQGGFEEDANETIDDILLLATTLTVKYDAVIPNSEARLFHYYYEDERDMAKPDNTPAGSGLSDGDIEMHTLGFHALNTFNAGPGTADFLTWGAYQFGDWGSLDHKAWAFALEGGYHIAGIAQSIHHTINALLGDEPPEGNNAAGTQSPASVAVERVIQDVYAAQAQNWPVFNS